MILLFGFDSYYPSGGLNDLIDKFETYEEMMIYIKNIEYPLDYYQAYDTEINNEIYIEKK